MGSEYSGASGRDRLRFSERETNAHMLRRRLARAVIGVLEETEDPEVRRVGHEVLIILSIKDQIGIQNAQERVGFARITRDGEELNPTRTAGMQTESTRLIDTDGIVDEKAPWQVAVEHATDGSDSSGGITTRKPPKKFGIFYVVEAVAQDKMYDPNSDFFLDKGDSYIELHLPEVELPKDRPLERVAESLASLAEYIGEKGLKPKYVMGITHERLARAASRQIGFQIIDPNMPQELREVIERTNDYAVQDGLKAEPMGPLVLIYQEIDTFLDKFASR